MGDRTMRWDGRELFGPGRHVLEAGSWRRQAVERGFAGLDGVLSVDLGRRERKLKQRGWLSAPSRAALARRLEATAACVDGQAHVLTDGEGKEYPNVRMDSFRMVGPAAAGSQAGCEYEIVYTQLGE